MSTQNNVEVKCAKSDFAKVKFQYLAVIVANVISLCHGCAIGWLSPSLPILQSTLSSPLLSGRITLNEISWIGSCFAIGAICGNFVFGILSNFIGRKNTILLLAFPNMLFWIIVLNAQYVEHLYIARILAGSTGGGIYICIPLFVAEIADQRIRGKLGSLLMLSVTTGILCSFVAGSHLNYMLVPKIFLVLPNIFFVAFTFLPETPQHYIARSRIEKANKSLKFYRNCHCDGDKCVRIDAELKEIQQVHEQNLQKGNDRVMLGDFAQWNSVKAILIGFCLTAINLFSGSFAMVNYTASIFKASGSNLDPHLSSIIVAAIQICGVYGSTLLVDRFGRKMLLTISTSGACLGLTSLGTYSFLNSRGVDLSAFNWAPLASFSIYIFISCLGILPLPFIIIAEILPQKIRKIGLTICMTSNSIFAFISLKLFPILMHELDLYGVAAICATVCLLGLLFSIFILPETKGKNLNTSD